MRVAALAEVNRKTLREQVLTNIRASILAGSLPPGTKLAETELAEQLGVSRGTVREALRYLQQSGLVEGAERNSLRVRRLSPTEIAELHELRSVVESQAAVKVLARPDRIAVIDDLEELLTRIDSATTYNERFERDLAFHEALVHAGGNQMLLAAWQNARELMWITVLSNPNPDAELLMARANHQPIIDALRDGDEQQIRKLVVDHLTKASDSWVSWLS